MIHRTDRVGYKAGALEAGLATARGDFVCILDADFVPQRALLRSAVHFFTDPKVGMIQTRWGHINRGYSLLTRVQAMFLDGHLLLEQVARSRSGRFFNFNGTAGLWRKSCIAESGGWQHDTLTEDLDLSYRAQLAGWKFVFLTDVVTPAELPVDMNGFKSQQHRWTKGSIQTCKKLLPRIWRSGLPLPIKIEATGHLTSNFAYLLLACLCVLLHPSAGGPQSGWLRMFLLDVPIFLSASVSVAVFYICAQRELHPRTWVKEILLLPALIALGVGLSINNARAVLEAVFNHPSEFTRTPKYGIENKSTDLAIVPLHAAQISPADRRSRVSRFTLATLSGMPWPTNSILPCPSSSCFNADFFTSLFPRSPSGGLELISLARGKLHFLRDKLHSLR